MYLHMYVARYDKKHKMGTNFGNKMFAKTSLARPIMASIFYQNWSPMWQRRPIAKLACGGPVVTIFALKVIPIKFYHVDHCLGLLLLGCTIRAFLKLWFMTNN